METVKNFIVKNYKTILAGLVGLFLLYWFIFILTPKSTMLERDRKQIDALNEKIEKINEEQNKLEDQITDINQEVVLIETNVKKYPGKSSLRFNVLEPKENLLVSLYSFDKGFQMNEEMAGFLLDNPDVEVQVGLVG